MDEVSGQEPVDRLMTVVSNEWPEGDGLLSLEHLNPKALTISQVKRLGASTAAGPPSFFRARHQVLEATTHKNDPSALKAVLPASTIVDLMKHCISIFEKEPTVIELSSLPPDASAIVVGDTHGQFHDVLRLFSLAGPPSDLRCYVLNGDYVDRGSWGLEELVYLLAMKAAAPRRVVMLRGNHESSFCTKYYGFSSEVQAKYGKQSKEIYKWCKKLFTNLPLACVVGGQCLVLHGGLFRKPPQPRSFAKGVKRQRIGLLVDTGPMELGSLSDLMKSTKGSQDPQPASARDRLSSDVLWSDPIPTNGISFNEGREIGCVFGPDMTERFLREGGLKAIIRSHEGPDARAHREDDVAMPGMLDGFTLDHDTPSGRLYTVFSAPDYPQWQDVPPEDRYRNKGAVAVLRGPDWASPEFRQFEAVLPRPQADAFYDFTELIDSGDEPEGATMSEGGSDASGLTGGHGSDLEEGDEGEHVGGAAGGSGSGSRDLFEPRGGDGAGPSSLEEHPRGEGESGDMAPSPMPLPLSMPAVPVPELEVPSPAPPLHAATEEDERGRPAEHSEHHSTGGIGASPVGPVSPRVGPASPRHPHSPHGHGQPSPRATSPAQHVLPGSLLRASTTTKGH